MLRTVYGFDDLGRKVPMGSYDDGLRIVGGKIFYINSNSDETIKFYDAQGNELSNVGVGDTPTYYKIISTGVSEKDKYYVYNEDGIILQTVWGFDYTLIGSSATSIGSGKTNSEIALSHANPHSDNVWKYLQSYRVSSLGNCSDWYCGSKDEIEQFYTYCSSFLDVEKNPFEKATNKAVFSSSEIAERNVYAEKSNGTWPSGWNKSNYSAFIPFRSF